MQNPEEEIKISSSLDRILQQKHRLKNYSEIHYERIRQRSLENNFINFPSNSYYRQREEYVQQNHKNLFMRPIDFYYKSNLYFNYQPSPSLAEKVLNYKTIFNEGSEEVNNQKRDKLYSYSKEKSIPKQSRIADHQNTIQKKKRKITVFKSKQSAVQSSSKAHNAKESNFNRNLDKYDINLNKVAKAQIIHLKKNAVTNRKPRHNANVLQMTENQIKEIVNERKQDKTHHSFSFSQKEGRNYQSNSVDQRQQKNLYIPISERLIMNKSRPYVFIGQAAYTKCDTPQTDTQKLSRSNAQQARSNSLRRKL